MLDVLGEVHRGLGLYDEGRTVRPVAGHQDGRYDGDRHQEVAATAGGAGLLEVASGHYARGRVPAERGAGHPPGRARPVGPGSGQRSAGPGPRGRLPAATRNPRRTTARPRPSTSRIPPCRTPSTRTCLNDYALDAAGVGRSRPSRAHVPQGPGHPAAPTGRRPPRSHQHPVQSGPVVEDRGDYKAAEPIQRQVLALDRQHYDDNHPNVAYSLMSLGNTLVENGHYDEAERDFSRGAGNPARDPGAGPSGSDQEFGHGRA